MVQSAQGHKSKNEKHREVADDRATAAALAHGVAKREKPLSTAPAAHHQQCGRTKPSGRVNKNLEGARQRAGADLAAALPKNETLLGAALAALMNHPMGKRAAAAMGMEAPQDAAARKAAKRLSMRSLGMGW